MNAPSTPPRTAKKRCLAIPSLTELPLAEPNHGVECELCFYWYDRSGTQYKSQAHTLCPYPNKSVLTNVQIREREADSIVNTSRLNCRNYQTDYNAVIRSAYMRHIGLCSEDISSTGYEDRVLGVVSVRKDDVNIEYPISRANPLAASSYNRDTRTAHIHLSVGNSMVPPIMEIKLDINATVDIIDNNIYVASFRDEAAQVEVEYLPAFYTEIRKFLQS